MTDPKLLQALDYILNKSEISSIEARTEAVVRRRRNVTIFRTTGDTPYPQRMAREITEKINAGIGSGIEGMKKSIREMIIRIIKEHAPELSDGQIDELCQAWLPDAGGQKREALPRDLLVSMIEQFISFSRGTMRRSVDRNLREEMGAWPERYWKAFPPVIRLLISDLLKYRITEKDFYSQVDIALNLRY